jgi:mannose-6-phosphate isomerase
VNIVELPPNQLHHFYCGGAAIARFRGTPANDDHAPEDWVGSATAMFGSDGRGLTRLADGRLLRDAIAENPAAYLGPEHEAAHGADPCLLVKLLDAGERLPVHFHPDDAFARERLGLAHGKTEAWEIVEADAGAQVWLGFREDVDTETVEGWIRHQNRDGMLEALNPVPVTAGDAVFVPAGLAHAIGEGIFMVELQEPADLSVLLEWTGFEIDGERDGHLGLGFDVALQALRTKAVDGQELAALKRGSSSDERRLLPEAADAFFRAERLRPDPSVLLEPAFSILVVLDGSGRLKTESGEIAVDSGQTFLVPHGAGEAQLTGDVHVLRCLPPAPRGGAA